MGEIRVREAGLLPLGAEVRDVEARADKLRARVDDRDVDVTSTEAQLGRFRLEAAEAKRQLQVAEVELLALPSHNLTSGAEAGFLTLAAMGSTRLSGATCHACVL